MQFDVKAPILGFESIQKMELNKIDDIFMRLQAVDAQEPSFTLINPFILREYEFDIPTVLQSQMGINDDSNLLIFNVMIVQQPIENSVINFAAPIVFNTDNQTMAQVIINDNPDLQLADPISNYLKVEEHV